MSSDLSRDWEENEFVSLSVKSQPQTYCCVEHHCQLSPPKQMQNLFSEPTESLLQPLITRGTVSSLQLSHSPHLHFMSQPQRELKLYGGLHHLWKMETSCTWISAFASSLQNATQERTELSPNSAHWFTQTSTTELTFDFCLLPTNCILLQSGRDAALPLLPFISQKDSENIWLFRKQILRRWEQIPLLLAKWSTFMRCLQTKPSPPSTVPAPQTWKAAQKAKAVPPKSCLLASLAWISLFTTLTHFFHTSGALQYHHLLEPPQLWHPTSCKRSWACTSHPPYTDNSVLCMFSEGV